MLRRGTMPNVTIGALALTFLAAGALHEPLTAQSMRTVTMSRQLTGDDEVRVAVSYGAGRFTVRSIDEGLLYRMNLTYDEDAYEPVADFSGDRLELGVQSIRGGRSLRGRREAGELALELGRGVPMRLDLEFGAVRADIDLGGLELSALELSTGASESSIDISELNRAQIGTARFEVGAAEFTARHLGNLNAERIEVDAGVGSLVDRPRARRPRAACARGVGPRHPQGQLPHLARLGGPGEAGRLVPVARLGRGRPQDHRRSGRRVR
jgi:hypothetical protein